MFKSAVKTIVGGAIGLLSLYAVARVSYSAGKEAAEQEEKERRDRLIKGTATVEDIRKPVEQPKKLSKLGILTGLVRAKKKGVFNNLVSHPENHKFEAEMDESGAINISIKPKAR